MLATELALKAERSGANGRGTAFASDGAAEMKEVVDLSSGALRGDVSSLFGDPVAAKVL